MSIKCLPLLTMSTVQVLTVVSDHVQWKLGSKSQLQDGFNVIHAHVMKLQTRQSILLRPDR